MAATEIMKVLHKVKPSLLGSRITFRCARGSISDGTKLSQINFYQPVMCLERFRNFLEPNRSKKLLLQMVNRASVQMADENFFLSLRKWIVDDFSLGKAVHSKNAVVCRLLHTCSVLKEPKFFCALIYVVKKHRIKLKDDEINALLGAMSTFGWHHSVKINFRKMTKQAFNFRIGTLYSILLSAVRSKDLKFAADLMHRIIQCVLDKPLPMKEFWMGEVMKGCVGSGKGAASLVNKVMEWYWLMEDLHKEDVDSFAEWLHSVEGNYRMTKTNQLSNGHCRNCGEKLVLYNISASDHALLRREIAKVIAMLEERHLPNYPQNSFLRKLTRFVNLKHFGVAIDVMNVGQLHKVIAEVKKITDKPILAITRKKCSRGLTGFHPKLKVQEIVKELKDVHNTHLFFVDYRIDDDLYTLYGALVGSQDTLLLTNDHLNDKTKLVSNDCMAVLEKWKKMRLVRVNHGHDVNGKTVLTMPPGIKVAKREEGENFHLSYTDGTNNYCLCIQQ